LICLGKDTRYVLEKNIGCEVLGNQRSGWLFSQTEQLTNLGVIVSYSGDAPFIERITQGLVLSEYVVSKLSVYIDDHHEYTTTTVNKETGLRTDVHIPFSEKCPPQSLMYYDSPRSICPDIVHMTIRCVEHDLRKIAQKILKLKAPFGEESIRQLEMNLTERDIKSPSFEFIKERSKDELLANIGSVSLSGIEALAAIADHEEFEGTDKPVPPLYSGVWSDREMCIESSSRAGDVLRGLGYADLFNLRSEDNTHLMSWKNACDLLRQSLNECVKLARCSTGYVYLHVNDIRFHC
jgi:hypothetical protein